MWRLRPQLDRNHQQLMLNKGYIPVYKGLFHDCLLEELSIVGDASLQDIKTCIKNTKVEDRLIMTDDIVVLKQEFEYENLTKFIVYKDTTDKNVKVYKMGVYHLDEFSTRYFQHRKWSEDDIYNRIKFLFLKEINK